MGGSGTEAPINPLPPVVIALVAIVLGLELLFQLGTRGVIGGPGAAGWRLTALQGWTFSGEIFDWMRTNERWDARQLMRFVSYPLIHTGFIHALFVSMFLLALGKMVAEFFGPVAVLAIFFGSAGAGALAFAILLNDPAPLVGGYPAVYGLIGAYTLLMLIHASITGQSQAMAFRLIGLLLAIQLVLGLLFDTGNDWLADLAGAVTGFVLAFALCPGGWARALEMIRRR